MTNQTLPMWKSKEKDAVHYLNTKLSNIVQNFQSALE